MKLPKNVCAAAFESEYVRAGVLVAVATDVVKSGERLPLENEVTVPADAHVLSPRRYVVELAVPEAERSAIPMLLLRFNLPYVIPAELLTSLLTIWLQVGLPDPLPCRTVVVVP